MKMDVGILYPTDRRPVRNFLCEPTRFGAGIQFAGNKMLSRCARSRARE